MPNHRACSRKNKSDTLVSFRENEHNSLIRLDPDKMKIAQTIAGIFSFYLFIFLLIYFIYLFFSIIIVIILFIIIIIIIIIIIFFFC